MEMKELLLKGRLKTVINTSSNAVKTLKIFDPAALERPSEFKKLFGPYATSKMALSLWTREIAPRLAAEGILIRSADPGGNNTLRSSKSSGLPFYMKFIMKYFFPHPSRGAELLYKAALGSHRHESGIFLVKDQIARLKFAADSRKVLDKVHAIYEKDYIEARGSA
jgi:NAD(P)-dependent dehydrogenase (short-subunit alcohol dehydrogenase family)